MDGSHEVGKVGSVREEGPHSFWAARFVYGEDAQVHNARDASLDSSNRGRTAHVPRRAVSLAQVAVCLTFVDVVLGSTAEELSALAMVVRAPVLE